MKNYNFLGLKLLVAMVANCWITLNLNAQSSTYMPNGIPFQGLLRDNNNMPAKNVEAFVVATILDKNNKVLLKENFNKVVTNTDGIFTIILGTGIQVEGEHQEISKLRWEASPCYLQISVAIPPRGTMPPNWDYTNALKDMGKTQIWAVPYALTVGSVRAKNVVGASHLASGDNIIKVLNGKDALLSPAALEIDKINLNAFIGTGILKDTAAALRQSINKKVSDLVNKNKKISGDVTGTIQAAVVGKINGTKLGKLTDATDGQVLTYNAASGSWKPITPVKGSVSNLKVGGLAPLFTTTTKDSATTPKVNYTLTKQMANTIFAGPINGGNAAPSFRTLSNEDLPNSGIKNGEYHGLVVNNKGIITRVIPINYQTKLELSTGGTGEATLNGAKLNIPTYILPTATASNIGGVKIGSGLSITEEGVLDNSGVISFSTGTTGLISQSGSENITLDGILKVANGGTGLNEAVQGGLLYGVSASAVSYTPAGVKGQLLQSNGNDAPIWIDAALPGWSLKGNAKTNSKHNFIGTTDNESLVFKCNNKQAGLLSDDNSITAFGTSALEVNSGIENTAFGKDALAANQDGIGNTGVGYSSLIRNINGSYNVAIGSSSLSHSTGTANIALGTGAGRDLIEGNFNIIIGTDIDLPLSRGSYQLNIGNAIYGINVNNRNGSYDPAIGIKVSDPTSTFEVNGSATNHKAFDAKSSLTIDFAKSNLAYTNQNPNNTFTLLGIKDGGTYTLAVMGTKSGQASFSADGFTFKSTTNAATIAGKETLYTFVVMKDKVYYYMASGF